MDENRLKVLEMLADGRISAAEAERLLDRLDAAPDSGSPSGDPNVVALAERRPPKNPKFLRVMVNSADGNKVNVRVPMALIRTGVRLGALMPNDAREQIEAKGIDFSQLSELDADELVAALSELTVDVESEDGDTVRVFCE